MAVIVQQGKVLDYIDGVTQRPETPEEYVRQEIAKSLVREYGYQKGDVSVQFTLRPGTRRPRADLVIFDEGHAHDQDRARIIVECKSRKIKPTSRRTAWDSCTATWRPARLRRTGCGPTESSDSATGASMPKERSGFDEIPDIPSWGSSEDEAERPRFDQLKAASSDALLFAFRRCHNHIAGNQGLQKPEAFWELLKIIFCKIHDERNSDEIRFYATSKEQEGPNSRLEAKKRLG